MKIRHIINPVCVQPESDLYLAQPITFASMIAARHAAQVRGIDVDLCFTCYPEDIDVAPREFRNAGLLDRSILDIVPLTPPRKLPLIADIINRALAGSDVDMVIYTNVDIAVQPEFYVEVERLATQGYDAFTINRRTLPKHYHSPAQLSLMYLEQGERHPGHDCFIFKPVAARCYDLRRGCIGANWIGRILLANLMARSDRFHVFDNKRLTFHVGDDRSWNTAKFNDYDSHNEQELVEILESLLQHEDVCHVTDLRGMYDMHHDRLHSRRMIRENTFHRPLPVHSARFLPITFKGSTDWKVPVLLDQSPIFVVGYPRSGTTLLQSKLMTQAGVVSLPETHFFSIVRNQLRVREDRIDPTSLDAVFGKLRERFPLSFEMEKVIRSTAETSSLSPKMLFEAIVADGLLSVYDIKTIAGSRLVEKTPDHAERLDIIFRWYPRARVINIVRHPEKAIISRRQNFVGEEAWPIQEHALRWRASVSVIDKYRSDRRFMSVKLEDLAANEMVVMGEICEFVGIPFDAEKLSGAAVLASRVTLPWEHWKSDSQKNISAEIAHRVSVKLSLKDRNILQCIAGEQLEGLGYSLDVESVKCPSDSRRSVVVFSHIPSHPCVHGNSKRIYAVCQNFKNLGFKVGFFYYLVHPNLSVDYAGMLEAWDDVRVCARQAPAPVSRDGYFHIDDACEEGLSKKFAAYCRERNAGVALVNYVFYSGVFSFLPPDVLRVLDTHDRFADRHLKLEAMGVPQSLWWYSFTPAEEGVGLSRADVVLAIQEEEAHYFSTVTDRYVAVMPHLEQQQACAHQPGIPFLRAGFLGSDNPVNVEAVRQLVSSYLRSPRVEQLPELLIAGKVCNEIIADHPKIRILGPIASPDQLYSAVDVIVIPLEFGTGLKIKAVEALANGLPIVSTAHGSIGLGSSHPLLNLPRVEDIVDKLAELSQPYAAQRARELCDHCKLLFGAYHLNAKTALKAILSEAMKNKDSARPPASQQRKEETTLALISDTRALISRLVPPACSVGLKALFIGHGFHQRTNSSRFFIDYLEKIFDLQLYWLRPHESDANYPDDFIGRFDFVFFWQLMPDRRITDHFIADCVICIPMYDATGVYEANRFNPRRWLPLKEYSFIAFCRSLHQDLKGMGIRSFHLQYAPNDLPVLEVGRQNQVKPRVLYLFRRSEISWSLVRQLFAPNDVESVHIHVATDPKHHFDPPPEADLGAYRISISTWFDNREEYDELLDRSDVFVAPRLYEGIGMAFLDAMARGLCVVAPDRPTMNEYIEQGIDGLLFDPLEPRRLDVSNWKMLGIAGRRKLEHLSREFRTSLKVLRLFLKAQPTLPRSAAEKNGETSRPLHGRRVLLVFPHNPFLKSNGVQSRFFGLLGYFKSRGIAVDMLSHSNFVDCWDVKDPQVTQFVKNLYLEDFVQAKASGVVAARTNSPLPDFAFRNFKIRFDELIRANSYDLVIVGYVHWANLVCGVSQVRTMIMIEDCVSQNLMERRGGVEKFDYDASLADEAERIDMFDVAVFISPKEMELFSQFCRKVKMFHVPHMIDVSAVPKSNLGYEDRRYDLIFVGSDNPFNVSAMNWFLAEVWPRIAETTTLAVVGGVCDELNKRGLLSREGSLYFLGRVEDLGVVYHQSRIAICPMLQGTGLKIKAAEALAYGVPVIALPAGLIGMTGNRRGCVEVDTPAQFERAIRLILDSPVRWAELSDMARKTAEELFGYEHVSQMLDAVLDHAFQSTVEMSRCNAAD